MLFLQISNYDYIIHHLSPKKYYMDHNLEVNKSDSHLLSDNYIIIKKIGSGSFGEVYLAQHKNGGYVAAKVEDRTKAPRVLNEYKIYRYLQKHGFIEGIPKMYGFIQTPDYNIMFMQLLGPSLEDIFTESNKKFTLSKRIRIN